MEQEIFDMETVIKTLFRIGKSKILKTFTSILKDLGMDDDLIDETEPKQIIKLR